MPPHGAPLFRTLQKPPPMRAHFFDPTLADGPRIMKLAVFFPFSLCWRRSWPPVLGAFVHLAEVLQNLQTSKRCLTPRFHQRRWHTMPACLLPWTEGGKEFNGFQWIFFWHGFWKCFNPLMAVMFVWQPRRTREIVETYGDMRDLLRTQRFSSFQFFSFSVFRTTTLSRLGHRSDSSVQFFVVNMFALRAKGSASKCSKVRRVFWEIQVKAWSTMRGKLASRVQVDSRVSEYVEV